MANVKLELLTRQIYETMNAYGKYPVDTLLKYLGMQTKFAYEQIDGALKGDVKRYGGIPSDPKISDWGNFMRQIVFAKGVVEGLNLEFYSKTDAELDAVTEREERKMGSSANTPSGRTDGSRISVFSPQDIGKWGKYLGYKGEPERIIRTYAEYGRK